MEKILFNDKYCLTQAVLNGTKTMTRRVLKEGTPLGNWEETAKCLPYKVGDIVAIAQPYKDIIECMAEYSDIMINVDGSINREYKAGWTNRMFVRADLLPHHIRITDVKVEHLQDISDKECLREGVKRASIGFYAEGVKVKNGTVSLDFEGNEGDMWEEEAKDLIPYKV
mgnify:CR=1 FL=1|jgi:hypothetical protein